MSTCAKCNWWSEKYEDNGDDTNLGECHRYPPIPFRSTNSAELKQIHASTTYPVTHKTEFCGEYNKE